MPMIQVTLGEDGSVNISTDGIQGDLDFLTGKALTDGITAEMAAALGEGLIRTSEVEQHRDGGVRHAHLHNHNRGQR